jgi:hypothetical protein
MGAAREQPAFGGGGIFAYKLKVKPYKSTDPDRRRFLKRILFSLC